MQRILSFFRWKASLLASRGLLRTGVTPDALSGSGLRPLLARRSCYLAPKTYALGCVRTFLSYSCEYKRLSEKTRESYLILTNKTIVINCECSSFKRSDVISGSYSHIPIIWSPKITSRAKRKGKSHENVVRNPCR